MTNIPSGTVTFLFTDIEGSTKIAQEHPDQWETLRERHHAILQSAMDLHNGYVFQIIGDAFCAAFHSTNDGIRAAIDAQRQLQNENWGETSIKVRMGIHTGEAEKRENDYRGYLTMAKAQRVMSVAYGGQVLLSNASAELIHNEHLREITLRDMKENRIKGWTNPEHLWQVVANDLQDDFPPLKTVESYRHNLPERLTTFIGRDDEILRVCELIRQPSVRMVTVTGVGGIGKTSLSIQVGLKLLEDFHDGVFFVDLSSLLQANLLLPTIAQVFSLHELPEKPLVEVLIEHLARKKTLVILDNFEQLAETAPKLSNLLSATKQLKILITSRELLRLSAEHHFPLAPLSIAQNSDLHSLFNNEAIQLFAERLQAVRPDFRLNKEHLVVIAEICRQLDGLPLAIELAAARGRLFTPPELLSQLTHRFQLLTGGPRDLPMRHQTMRSAIEWSYELLSSEEKRLFQRFAVFVGGCKLDAVHNICGDDEIDVLSGIESLLDKHMINIKEFGGESRFWMFETLREFAMEKLKAGEDAAVLFRKHAMYYSNLATNTDDELDNIRSVFRWSFATGEAEPALRLVNDFFFWEKRIPEGLHLITKVLALQGAQEPTQERGHALYSAAVLSHFHRKNSAAQVFGNELMKLGYEIGDNGFVWQQKLINGLATTGEGHYESAYEIVLDARNNADSSFRYALCTLGLASCALGLHNLERAQQFAKECRRIFDELSRKNYLIDSDTILGYIALEANDLGMALQDFRHCIEIAILNSVQQRLGVIYTGLGGIALRKQEFYEAARWFGISEMTITTTGYYARFFPETISNGYVTEVRSLLDPNTFQTAWEEGYAVTADYASALALKTVENI